MGRILPPTIASLALLSACGTTEVVQLSPSTYTVSSSHGVVDGSWDKAQQEAVAKAKDYCAAKGKGFVLLNEQRSGVPGFSMQESKITFGCGEDPASVAAKCKTDLQTPALDSIRDKVELFRNPDDPVPFAIATNDSFPAEGERDAIAVWAKLRDECVKRSGAAAQEAGVVRDPSFQRLRSIGLAASGRIGELIVSLYQQKLTYGEFAKKRYDIGREAAEAEQRFRQSIQIADQAQRVQAQQLAEQQFQSSLAAWSAYMQAVNARQPLSVRMQSNCNSVRVGNTVNTVCN